VPAIARLRSRRPGFPPRGFDTLVAEQHRHLLKRDALLEQVHSEVPESVAAHVSFRGNACVVEQVTNAEALCGEGLGRRNRSMARRSKISPDSLRSSEEIPLSLRIREQRNDVFRLTGFRAAFVFDRFSRDLGPNLCALDRIRGSALDSSPRQQQGHHRSTPLTCAILPDAGVPR
jgi:hypothetical protein